MAPVRSTTLQWRLQVQRIWTVQSVLDGFGLICLVLFFLRTQGWVRMERAVGLGVVGEWWLCSRYIAQNSIKANTNENKE